MKIGRVSMKKLKSYFTLVISVLVLSLITPVTVPVIGTVEYVSAAVKISNKSVTLIKGQSKTLKVTGTSKQPKWSTNNKLVVTVNKNGKITAKSKGAAVVTAKIGAASYKCKVTVETPYLSRQTITLNSGAKSSLKLNGTKQKVVWKSSNANIAAVTSGGVVTGKNTGKCYVYARVAGKNYKCSVVVKKVTPQENSVWISETGSKYHRISNCGTMNPNKARKMSLSDAISKGYSACKKCF